MKHTPITDFKPKKMYAFYGKLLHQLFSSLFAQRLDIPTRGISECSTETDKRL